MQRMVNTTKKEHFKEDEWSLEGVSFYQTTDRPMLHSQPVGNIITASYRVVKRVHSGTQLVTEKLFLSGFSESSDFGSLS